MTHHSFNSLIVKRLNSFVSLAATKRRLFLCTLLCILPISVLAQTTLDWANRVTAGDPKVRAISEAALVQGRGRSLPLLRRFLDLRNEDLDQKTFDIIRRI